ncbi:MAG TPA: LysR substrate-binding domain-containing protein, partial [Beijerinckiaceae bacterium]|nr:LysR substrate-binding domain-containing protein [Beijerinckiaceae bacterium]
LTSASPGRHFTDRVFAEAGVSRVLRVETSLSEIMCGLVSSGFGVAVCDPFTAAEFASRGVVSRPFLPRIDFEFAAVFPPQRSPSPIAQEFVELFAGHVRGMAQNSA